MAGTITIDCSDLLGIGTNRQIKNGAKLVTSPEEIIEELKIKIKLNKNVEEKQIEIIDIPEEYLPVYKYISDSPINIDELCKKTKLEISKVNYLLTMMEVEGYIEQIPGKNFIKIYYL